MNFKQVAVAGTCVCEDGFWLNGDRLCEPCQPGCTSCTSASDCASCNSTLNFVANGSSCSCVAGYYLNDRVCTLCPNGCNNCTSATSCSACNSTRNFVLNGSTCVCATGFFLNTTTNECQTCSSKFPGCIKCSGLNFCESCNATANFWANGSSCRCANGFYLTASNNCSTCQDFGSQCLTCNPTGCLTCGGDFVVNSTGCLRKCNITGCLECYNSTVCFSCGPHFSLSGSKAVCSCNQGFYLSANQCLPCINGCASCVGPTDCSQCLNGWRYNRVTEACQFESLLKATVVLVISLIAAFMM